MARTFTKGIDLYNAQRDRFRRLQLTMREGHRELAEMGLADAKELTSGTLTPSQTRGAFARGPSQALSTANGRRRRLTKRQARMRGVKGGVPLLPVNIQTGRLNRSMILRQVAGRGIQNFDLTQVDPGGGIWRLEPGGTRKMVASGFFAEVKRRWRARNKAFFDHYIKQSHI